MNNSAENSQNLLLALTKGRLEKAALSRLSELGYDVSELTDKEKRGRKLIFKIPNSNLSIIISKSADVITYVSRGICDIGITGKDSLLEEIDEISDYFEIADLGIGKCKFSFASKKGGTEKDFFTSDKSLVIASKYPNVARRFFQSKGVDVEIVKIEGSVELAPILGLSDGIVDIVESGATLKANGLDVISDICDVSARLIVNRVSLKIKKNAVESFSDNFTKIK